MECCSIGYVPMETTDPILKIVPMRMRSATVLVGGLICMLSYGSVYTFGNLLPYMVSFIRWKVNPQMTAGSMIWLQTLMSGVPLAMLVGGILERRHGGRKAAFLGSFIYTLGTGVTYYTIQHSFAALLLSMGLFASFGGSIAYNSILATAQRWLPDNIGLAGGIIVGGYGCGAFILSPLQTTFINPLNYQVNDDGYFTQEDLLERVPCVFIAMSVLFTIIQSIGLMFIAQPQEELSVEADELIMNGVEQSVGTQLTSKTFLVLFLSLTCNAIWVQLISGLYKTYGQQFINSDLFLSFVGSMASIVNATSRIVWGIVVDRTSYQLSMTLVCVLGASLIWLMPVVRFSGNHILFLTSVCAMFSCIGGTYSLFPYITHKCFSKANFGVIYGTLQCALSVAGIIAGLLSQFALPFIGFDSLFLICGLFMVASLVLTSMLHCTDLAYPQLKYSIIEYENNE